MNTEYKGVVKHFLVETLADKRRLEYYPSLAKVCMETAGKHQ